MRGEVWKCAKEQVRGATMEEEEAYGLLREEMEELREEIQRKSSKRGYKDISQLEFPTEGEEEMTEEEMEPPLQRPRIEETQQEVEAEPSAAGGTGSEATAGGESSSSSSSSSDSKEEPEGEKIDEGQMDSAVQSLMRSEVLDGTMRPQDAAAQYGPRRARLEQMRFKPYNFFVINEEEKQEDPSDQIGAEEEWIFCEERKSLIRRHGEYRKGGFIPVEKRGSPIDPKFLQSQCRVVKHYLDGKMEVKKMNWRKREEKEVGPQRHWVGETEFFIKANCVDKIRWHMMAKKSSDEVRECDITPEEWPEWKIADAEEWEKVASTNAVRAMSVEESKDVMNQLREGGIQDRVLPSRMVRRWKPAELPGEAPTRKSR